MPIYEYRCESCGLMFERTQAFTDDPLKECPECHGDVHRIVSGGLGFIIRKPGLDSPASANHGCSLENIGRTCCGKEERCDKPPCHEDR